MWTDLQAARLVQKKYEENRKELIANISHDLKTPITSILGYVADLTSIELVYQICAFLPLIGIITALLPNMDHNS